MPLTSLQCVITFGGLLEAFEEAGWTQEQIGWFLLGAAVPALTKSGVPLYKIQSATEASHSDSAKSSDAAS